jgi:hypothetical protein
MSLLVPVFTALQKRVASTLSVPKVRARALPSDRMSPTMKAARASSAGGGSGLASAATATALKRPPLASVRKALVRCSSGTSALPSARL